MGRLFGTDGVRGIVNEFLNAELALKLSLAIGTFFGPDSKLLIGRDARLGGELIRNAVLAGLLSTGVKVYDAGYAPTPCIQYNIKIGDFDGGVIITASHNPPGYNGIKVIASNGVEISRDSEREIEDIYFNSRFRYVSWRELIDEVPKYPGVIERYIDGVLEHVDVDLIKSKEFKVVIDPGNSVGTLPIPYFSKKLGLKTYTVNSDLNGLFPAREPEPTPESLRETAKVVKAVNADLGVGFDGDADRAIFIDELGRVFWGDRSAAIICKYLIEVRGCKGRIYTPVSSSILIEEYLGRYPSIEIIWMKVGSVDVAHAMLKDSNVLCGFEENGGFIYPEHQYVRDSFMTLALILEVLAREGRKLSNLFNELPRYVPLKTKVPMNREDAYKVIERLKERYSNVKLITVDGVKAIFEDGWVLVRPSGTEPVLRIMAEAKSEERVREIVEDVKNVINEVLKS